MKKSVFEYIIVELDADGEIAKLPGTTAAIIAKDKQAARESALMESVQSGPYKPEGVGITWDVVVRPFA